MSRVCTKGNTIEDGSIIFIGSTTENPFVSMTKAIVSRCRIFELKPLGERDIISGLKKAVADKVNGLGGYDVSITDDALAHFAWAASGDMRNALNALELAVLSTPVDKDGKIFVDVNIAAQSAQKKAISVDESLYYDMLSALCKSLRGSDPNAALYWAFRLVEAGCDPLLIFRRVLCHASEDVGLADSNALIVATNAYLAYERLGMPEGSLQLTHAIIYVCSAPKSNSVVTARDRVTAAVQKDGNESVPHYLRDRSYTHPIDDKSVYKYPHEFGGYCRQQYLPDHLKNEVFYRPSDEGYEKNIKAFYDYIQDEIKKQEV